jgi:flagellar secretion chaperone FliS
MSLSTTELSYRRSAIEGASPIGLMIALFDTLAGDFRRAALAIRKNDIETRCRELNHAALVLGQLENWLDLNNGGDSAHTLVRFYAYLRSKMTHAAASKSASLLDSQIEMILHVRSAWQQLDISPSHRLKEPSELPRAQKTEPYASTPEAKPDRVRFSQSA